MMKFLPLIIFLVGVCDAKLSALAALRAKATVKQVNIGGWEIGKHVGGGANGWVARASKAGVAGRWLMKGQTSKEGAFAELKTTMTMLGEKLLVPKVYGDFKDECLNDKKACTDECKKKYRYTTAAGKCIENKMAAKSKTLKQTTEPWKAKCIEFSPDGASFGSDDCYYFAIEDAGTSLTECFKLQELDTEQRLTLVKGMLHHINSLHKKGWAHGDCHPGNVVTDSCMEPTKYIWIDNETPTKGTYQMDDLFWPSPEYRARDYWTLKSFLEVLCPKAVTHCSEPLRTNIEAAVRGLIEPLADKGGSLSEAEVSTSKFTSQDLLAMEAELEEQMKTKLTVEALTS